MRPTPRHALTLLVALCCAASAEAQLYPSSVVGTEFDFIHDSDPDAFEALKFVGKQRSEMPDKASDAELMQDAFVFEASFTDGARVRIFLDADFGDEVAARKEALRYTPRLGKLPSALRHGIKRLVVHEGNPDTTAFSDVGLIVIYSANATKRISTHDLEETIFHESVHAAWDKRHAGSAAWKAAQATDGGFVTRYAQRNPEGEDLAESALFAFTLIHHPERIPAADAKRIREAIPARIAFVERLVPKGKPLVFPAGRAEGAGQDEGDGEPDGQ